MSGVKEVQYMRPHTVDELADLQQNVQRVFVGVPSLVAAAVLMQELHKRLTTNLSEQPAHEDPPEPLDDLIRRLDEMRVTFIHIAHRGITRTELVS